MTIILIWLLQPNGILFASIKFADLNHFTLLPYCLWLGENILLQTTGGVEVLPV